jgi:hypothetical protein
LAGGSLVKGVVKTGAKVAGKFVVKEAVEQDAKAAEKGIVELAEQSAKEAEKRVAEWAARGAAERGRTLTKQGELTDGVYTVSTEAMKKHVFGGVSGKSIFYPTFNANEIVLNAAQYADDAGLWIYNAGTKAKVPVLNSNIGTTGLGNPTNIINIYRKSNGMIHGALGN